MACSYFSYFCKIHFEIQMILEIATVILIIYTSWRIFRRVLPGPIEWPLVGHWMYYAQFKRNKYSFNWPTQVSNLSFGSSNVIYLQNDPDFARKMANDTTLFRINHDACIFHGINRTASNSAETDRFERYIIDLVTSRIETHAEKVLDKFIGLITIPIDATGNTYREVNLLEISKLLFLEMAGLSICNLEVGALDSFNTDAWSSVH